MSLTANVILIWSVMAVLTAAADMVQVRRRLAGKLGHAVQAEYQDKVRKVGGLKVAVTGALILDVLLWPVGVINLTYTHFVDQRAYQDELKAKERTSRMRSPFG